MKDTLEEINVYECNTNTDRILDQLAGLHLGICIEDTRLCFNLVQISAKKVFYD